MSAVRPSPMATRRPCAQHDKDMATTGDHDCDRPGEGVGVLRPAVITPLQAHHGDAQSREDTAGGCGRIGHPRLEPGRHLLEMLRHAGGVEADVHAHLPEDDCAGTEPRRHAHVARESEGLACASAGFGVPAGRQVERGGGLEQVPTTERTGDSLHAVLELYEFPLHPAQQARLEQRVDPPQAAPELGPCAADNGCELEHPIRQLHPIGDAVRPGAGELTGMQRLHDGGGISQRLSPSQRLLAHLAGLLESVAVDEGSSEPGVHPDSQVRREVASDGGLADPAHLGIPSRLPRGFQHERHPRKGHVVPAALGTLTHGCRRLMPAAELPGSVQGGGESELGEVAVHCRDLVTSDRECLAVEASGLFKGERIGSDVRGCLARRHGSLAVARQRRLDASHRLIGRSSA